MELTDKETRKALAAFYREMEAQVLGKGDRDGTAKYGSPDNVLASTEANLALYGADGVLWAVSEKLYRYKTKGRSEDLIKAAAWIALLWALEGKR